MAPVAVLLYPGAEYLFPDYLYCLPGIFTFAYNAFRDYFPRKPLLALWVVSALLVMTVFFFTPYLYFKFLFIFHISVAIFTAIFFFYLIRGGLRRRDVLALVSLIAPRKARPGEA